MASSTSVSDSVPEISRVNSDYLWSIALGSGISNNAFYSITACQEGGYIATGTIWHLGLASLLLVRIAENGRVLWQRIFQEFTSQSGSEVIECQSGGFAVIGSTTYNNQDALLVRTDESGNISWFRTYGRVTMADQGLALVECQSGGFAFAGFVRNANFTNSDFWLVRTDVQGNLLWAYNYGGARDDICYSLIETEEENFVLAGSTTSFGGGNEDVWILQINSAGKVLWNTTYGGIRADICFDIIQTNTGNYVISGKTETTDNFVSDGFAASILKNGTIEWNTLFGSSSRNYVYCITECIDGSYALTGQTIDWDGTYFFANLWLVRLDSKGDYLWSKSYGGRSKDVGRALLQTLNGDFVIAGISESLVEEGSVAWVLRVPNTLAPPDNTQVYGPPNFFLIGLGTALSLLVILGSYLLLYRGQRDISIPWSNPSKRDIQKSYLSPRLIEDLSLILTGLTTCFSCGKATNKANDRCSICSTHLHRCLFCNGIIQNDDLIIFCPGCGALAHHIHMLEWLKKQQLCPRCGLHFQKHLLSSFST